MRTRRFALVAALVTCLLPAAIADGQQGVERPFTLTGHSQVVITFTTNCYPGSQYFPVGCPYAGRGEGVASHLGRITTTDVGVFPNGGALIVGANEDQLILATDNAIGLMTIAGGTGRFEGATGVAIAVLTPVGEPIVGAGSVTQSYTWTAEGKIKY